MSKISTYADGGDPQAADQFAAARSGSNVKLIWSTIEAYLDTLYAIIANGVTNGDAHNHSGGDGAQIDHTTLSNIGTNTHAQIDAWIAATPGSDWNFAKKTVDESITSDTTLSQDSVLKFTATSGKTYAVRGKIFFYTPGAADFKYRFVFPGTTLNVLHTGFAGSGITPTITNDSASPGTTVALLGAIGYGYIEFDAVIVCDGSDRVFSFQWAQNTSALNPTTVRAGSYLEYIEIA